MKKVLLTIFFCFIYIYNNTLTLQLQRKRRPLLLSALLYRTLHNNVTDIVHVLPSHFVGKLRISIAFLINFSKLVEKALKILISFSGKIRWHNVVH